MEDETILVFQDTEIQPQLDWHTRFPFADPLGVQHRQRLFSSLHEHLGLLQILAIGFFRSLSCFALFFSFGDVEAFTC